MGGVGRGTNIRISHGASSDASINSISRTEEKSTPSAEKVSSKIHHSKKQPLTIPFLQKKTSEQTLSTMTNLSRRKLVKRTFVMSDGRQATIDNNDVKKLSYKAGPKKQIQIANLERLIEKANYVGSEYGVDHKKFVDFHYYAVTANYKGEQMNLLINVGTTKNDGTDHIYAINNNKKEEVPTHYGVSGPVGNRKKSTSSSNSISQTEEKSTPSAEKVSAKIRESRKISAEMSDDERAEILSRTNIISVKDISSASNTDFLEIKKIPSRAKSKIEKYVHELAENLGILRKPLSTPSLDIKFQISKNNGLKESLSQQLKYGGDYHDFARAIVNLQSLLDKAVLIETHSEDRYKNTSRQDIHFRAGHMLFSVLNDERYIYPVKMEIKQKADTDNALYLVVAMTKIKRTSVMESTLNNSNEVESPLSVTGSIYSLSRILEKINPKDKHFLKYFPDSMLTDEQIIAKQEALEEDQVKIERLKNKDSSEKIKHSRKIVSISYVDKHALAREADRKITRTRGQQAKFIANYRGEKVFNRNAVKAAIDKIEALSIFTKKRINALVDDLFEGYNLRLDSAGYKFFSDLMCLQIKSYIIQESDFELSIEQEQKLDEQIVDALNEIVASGKDSYKTTLEKSISNNELKKKADYWREEYDKALEQIKIRGRILSLAQKIKELKTGATSA